MYTDRTSFRDCRSFGSAIGIGHPYYETFEIIEKYQDRLRDEFDVVPVSKLLR